MSDTVGRQRRLRGPGRSLDLSIYSVSYGTSSPLSGISQQGAAGLESDSFPGFCLGNGQASGLVWLKTSSGSKRVGLAPEPAVKAVKVS